MRKLICFFAVMLVALSALAIPAHRGKAVVTQPDGTQLTIQLIGDEYYSFNTTEDGYTVVKNSQGVYEYAARVSDKLVASGVKAHDVAQRNASEMTYLAGITKYITDRESHASGEAMRAQAYRSPSIKGIDYSKFRGLIILVEFTDLSFTMSDPKAFYDAMVNTEGFTGYSKDDGTFVDCTGSVYDYYNENSNGRFKPKFDIVGPVKVNYASTAFNGTSNAGTIFRMALKAADNAGCDFSKYDVDNNGYVDMVFFQTAGLSASFSGNDSRLLWPHKSSFYSGPTYDGKRISLYACANELYGWSSNPSTIDVEGIGTICHEFTHVMGFPDLYDTDYEGSGGQSHHPGEWDIMAGGGNYNVGRTPAGYTIFERYAMGFAKPTVINEPGSYSLEPVGTSNSGYILYSPVEKEYWIIDNRQKSRWDYYLPGHGMVICRVDSTSVSPWTNHQVNCNPTHMYYEMVRAGNTTSDDLASDPFPGTKCNTMWCSRSIPMAKTWGGYMCDKGLYNIRETDGVITFDVRDESDVTCLIEDFETMPATTSTSETGVEGRFTKWNFTKCNVVETEEGVGHDAQAVKMLLPSQFTMATPIRKSINLVSFFVQNTSTTASKFALTYSLDGGTTWQKPRHSAGASPATIGGRESNIIFWPVDIKKSENVIFRVAMSAGSKTIPAYVDDFTVYYTDSGVSIPGDANGDGVVDITDANIAINIILGNLSLSDYPDADVDGNGECNITDVNAIINIILG